MPSIRVSHETWPVAGTFTISRGSMTETNVLVVELTQDGVTGRGECTSNRRYGDSIESIQNAIGAMTQAIGEGLDRVGLQSAMPAGPARNALDCAFWDLEAKLSGQRSWQLAGIDEPGPVTTALTISVGEVQKMAADAARHADRDLLKLKLIGEGDLERVEAVHRNAPNARLIVDANEAWSAEQYVDFAPRLAELGVGMIEQPLPAGKDDALAELPHPVSICADESVHDQSTLSGLAGKYEIVNIKLDKTGGLTEALALKAAALNQGFGIMIGCMIGTSLSMAPAMLVAQGAQYVDLDAPLLLEKDRSNGLRYADSLVFPSKPNLWG